MQNADTRFPASLADPHAHLQAGKASARADDWPRALAHFRVAVAAAPRMPESWTNLAVALERIGKLDDAERSARQSLALKPDLADAWNLLGLIEIDRHRFDAALPHLARALEIEPRYAVALMNLGIAQHGVGRDDEALRSLGQAIELDPSLGAAHYNIGAVHHERGEHAAAIERYRKAIALRPGDAASHFNLATALFITGRFEEAWAEYGWRPQRREYAKLLRRSGSSRMAIQAEQGLGDNLFFLRFAAAVRASGITLDFAGDQRLHAMLGRTGLFATMARRVEDLDGATRDVVLAADLPELLPGLAASVPPPLALTADPLRVAAMRSRLEALGPPPYVALAWRAGEPRIGRRMETLFKQVPPAEMGAALRGVTATWLVIQRDPRADEIDALARAIGAPVHDCSAVNTDLEDALALLAAAREYIGVSSTMVHLRAGVGGEARIVVPFPYEWRWMESGDRSPWFPQAAIYRQDADGRWDAAMSRLAADLEASFS